MSDTKQAILYSIATEFVNSSPKWILDRNWEVTYITDKRIPLKLLASAGTLYLDLYLITGASNNKFYLMADLNVDVNNNFSDFHTEIGADIEIDITNLPSKPEFTAIKNKLLKYINSYYNSAVNPD